MMKKLPVGIDGFEKIRRNDFYYVDKTGLIVDLLNNWGEVNLFTRPRRFGKSLNMSMLKAFFEVNSDKKLFDGLKIMKETQLCKTYMGRFPVISISLKGVDGRSFEAACAALRGVVGKEAMRFCSLLESDRMSVEDKRMYSQLIEVGNAQNAVFTMSDSVLIESLQTLSILLNKYYERKVIVLIDEYDVPLDKAYQSGFYDEMVTLMRNFLGNVLKSNDALQFAVLTGCLRISKESIFTGLNNLKVHTITDGGYDEYFGFTDGEVQKLLKYYQLSDQYKLIKEWYNGYRFGNVSVYCPWDVVNYCSDVLVNLKASPKNYWANTSGNAMVRQFIDKAGQQTRDEIERLIAGECITKAVNQELTYSELDSSIDHLWSVLFTTGYLTQKEKVYVKEFDEEQYKLMIPNKEIRNLFNSQIKEWFREKTVSEPDKLNMFCNAVIEGREETVQKLLTDYLKQTISIRDTSVRTNRKESFYHGLLIGLLSHSEQWIIKSNEESGDGYSDILIRDMATDTGVVIEVKYAENARFDAACTEALGQIETKNYVESLYDDGMEKIIKYGIAFYKKRCRVLRG